MAIINITDKFTEEKPGIEINGKVYEVNDSIEATMKFEELASSSNSVDSMIKAIEYAIGKEAVKALDVKKLSIKNFKTLVTALMAAMQGVSFEEAEARFQRS